MAKGPSDIPSPFDHPEIWERLTLRGPQGSLTLKNVTVNVKGGGFQEDRRVVKGQSGERASYLGQRDARVEVTVEAYTSAEFRELRRTLELYRNKHKATPDVLDVVHPNLELHGIKQMYLLNLDSEDFSPETGFVLKLEFAEHQEIKRAQTGVIGNSANPPASKNPDGSPASSAAAAVSPSAALSQYMKGNAQGAKTANAALNFPNKYFGR